MVRVMVEIFDAQGKATLGEQGYLLDFNKARSDEGEKRRRGSS
jgi:hypothetical protein